MWSGTCRLPQLLEGNMPGYSLAATRYDEDARKIGCARRVVGEHCNHSWLALNHLAAGCVRLQHCLYKKSSESIGSNFVEGQASEVLPQLSQSL